MCWEPKEHGSYYRQWYREADRVVRSPVETPVRPEFPSCVWQLGASYVGSHVLVNQAQPAKRKQETQQIQISEGTVRMGKRLSSRWLVWVDGLTSMSPSSNSSRARMIHTSSLKKKGGQEINLNEEPSRPIDALVLWSEQKNQEIEQSRSTYGTDLSNDQKHGFKHKTQSSRILWSWDSSSDCKT